MNKLTNRRTRARHYELTNHLGNVLTVVNDRIDAATQKPQIENSVAYEPFGRPVSGLSYYKDGANKYKFGFNTQLKDPELGSAMYSAQFWEYDGRLGRRWNVDPVVKPWQSPYHCFSNNPISRIDPNGDSDYTVDKDCNITLKGEPTQESNDCITSYYKDGSIKDEITIDKGIIESKKDYSFDGGSGYTLNAPGKEQGQKLFEFFANNTKAEWSIFKFDNNGNQNNVLSTSRDRIVEKMGSHLINKYLLNYDFIGFDHSHPDDDWKPSSSTVPLGEDGRCGGDIGVVERLEEQYYGRCLQFRIYNVFDGLYREYDSKTVVNNPIGEVNVYGVKK